MNANYALNIIELTEDGISKIITPITRSKSDKRTCHYFHSEPFNNDIIEINKQYYKIVFKRFNSFLPQKIKDSCYKPTDIYVVKIGDLNEYYKFAFHFFEEK